MIRLLTSLLLCTVCWSPTIGQDPSQLTEVDFRVKGVGLGNSYAAVLRQLGRPVSSRREKIEDEACSPPYTSLTLSYKGAVIEFVGDTRGRAFKVVSMEVTSPQYLITPRVKLGMSEQEVRSKLGEPWQVTNESGLQILNYVTKGNDGGAGLYFRNGRLVKLQWAYTAC